MLAAKEVDFVHPAEKIVSILGLLFIWLQWDLAFSVFSD